MSTNHRILGMENHVAYGVCFILPFLAIIVLIIDKQLSRENKQFMWEAILGWIAAFILGALTFFISHALAWVVHAIMIIIGLVNIFSHEMHLPFLDGLAAKIVK